MTTNNIDKTMGSFNVKLINKMYDNVFKINIYQLKISNVFRKC